MNIDYLRVNKIEIVYKVVTNSWARPIAHTRLTNGLVFFLSGSIKYDFSGKKIVATTGDLLILPKGSYYSGIKITDEQEFYVIDFETAEGCEFSKFFSKRVERIFQSLLNHWKYPTPSSKLLCISKLYELFAVMLEQTQINIKQIPSVISGILSYINENYNNADLKVSKICNYFNISETHLRRLFYEYINISPIEYIQQTRINYAKKMILDNFTIGDTAINCGYSSIYYFSRVFKIITGYTPSEYKKKYIV